MTKIEDQDGVGGARKGGMSNPYVANYASGLRERAEEKMRAEELAKRQQVSGNTGTAGISAQDRVETEGETSFSSVGEVRQLNSVTSSRDAENDGSNTGGGEKDQVSYVKGLVSHEAPVTLFSSLALNKISQTLTSWGITITNDMKQVLEKMEDNDPKATMDLAKKLPRMNRNEAREAVRQATGEYMG
jgi:hypothetical protein